MTSILLRVVVTTLIWWICLIGLSRHIEARSSPANEMCLACHGQKESAIPFVDAQTFGVSIHGQALQCVQCHVDAQSVPHPPQLQRADPQACATCHADTVQEYTASIHGMARSQGKDGVAGCSDCHGIHDIFIKSNPNSKVYPFNLPQTCGQCHDNAKLAEDHNIPVPRAYQDYMKSIHGTGLAKMGLLVTATCNDCHGTHNIQPATDARSTLHPRNLPRTCGQCHEGLLREYQASIHGKLWQAGSPQAPVCNGCHVSHAILPTTSDEFELASIKACGSCHAEAFATYKESYHGKVATLGYTTVAKCADCHSAHQILAPSEPESTLSSDHIVATCQKCHPQANANFVQFQPHADPQNAQAYPVLHSVWLFMNLLLALVFGVFGLHTGLWALRSAAERVDLGKQIRAVWVRILKTILSKDKGGKA